MKEKTDEQLLADYWAAHSAIFYRIACGSQDGVDPSGNVLQLESRWQVNTINSGI